MSSNRINRAIHWDGRGGQAWHEGSHNQLRVAPKINGKPVQTISYYPLSMVRAGRMIAEEGDTAAREMTDAEQKHVDMLLELMSRIGLSPLE
jgi:hypothetical protein